MARKTKAETQPGKWDYRPFRNWLLAELEKRQWRQADLARAMRPADPSGIASNISKWLRGDNRPEPRLCQELAQALGVDVNLVLELAGHKPVEPRNEREQRIENIRAALRMLPPEQLGFIEATVRALTEELRRGAAQGGPGTPEAAQKSEGDAGRLGTQRAIRRQSHQATGWLAALGEFPYALATL